MEATGIGVFAELILAMKDWPQKAEMKITSDRFWLAAEYAGLGGSELLTALAVACQVQCRLSEVAPVPTKGFDHTTQGAYAVAAGVSKALGLSQEQAANAIAIARLNRNASPDQSRS